MTRIDTPLAQPAADRPVDKTMGKTSAKDGDGRQAAFRSLLRQLGGQTGAPNGDASKDAKTAPGDASRAPLASSPPHPVQGRQDDGRVGGCRCSHARCRTGRERRAGARLAGHSRHRRTTRTFPHSRGSLGIGRPPARRKRRFRPHHRESHPMRPIALIASSGVTFAIEYGPQPCPCGYGQSGAGRRERSICRAVVSARSGDRYICRARNPRCRSHKDVGGHARNAFRTGGAPVSGAADRHRDRRRSRNPRRAPQGRRCIATDRAEPPFRRAAQGVARQARAGGSWRRRPQDAACRQIAGAGGGRIPPGDRRPPRQGQGHAHPGRCAVRATPPTSWPSPPRRRRMAVRWPAIGPTARRHPAMPGHQPATIGTRTMPKVAASDHHLVRNRRKELAHEESGAGHSGGDLYL